MAPSLLNTLLTLTAFLSPLVHAKTPSSGCGKTPQLVTSTSTTTPLTLTINNKARNYYVRLPPNYNNTHPYRLILTLHALGGQASQVIAGTGGYVPYYGLASLINDTTGAIFIAPNGLNNGWANQAGEDVTFLSSVISAVENDLCVDTDLRFSTGFSYGAAMSYALACGLGSKMRAVAALSGNPQISGCAAGSEPVAYYGQHGGSDTVLPLSGGVQMRDRFLRNNGCDVAGTVEAAVPAAGSGKRVKTVYKGCKEDKPVVWVVFDGPHTPTPKDPGAAETWAPGETWEFFQQFT